MNVKLIDRNVVRIPDVKKGDVVSFGTTSTFDERSDFMLVKTGVQEYGYLGLCSFTVYTDTVGRTPMCATEKLFAWLEHSHVILSDCIVVSSKNLELVETVVSI